MVQVVAFVSGPKQGRWRTVCCAPRVHRGGTGVLVMLLALVRRLCTCVLFLFVQLGACLYVPCAHASGHFYTDPVALLRPLPPYGAGSHQCAHAGLPLALFTGHACLVLAVASECLLGLAYVMPPMLALFLRRVKTGVCQFDFLLRVAGLRSRWFFFSLPYT